MKNNKVAIALWLYNTEQYQQFIDLLSPISPHIHLYLGLCTDKDIGIDKEFIKAFPNNIDIEWYPNIGADVLPFLHQLKTISQNNHKYLIKIHSKKRAWGYKQHVHWLETLVNDLLVKKYFLSNINQMNKSSSEMLGCKSLILTNQENTNTEKIKELCTIMNLPKIKKKSFIGGNIFMAKTKMFNVCLEYFNHLEKKLIKEHGYVSDLSSGKYCHSIERIFGYIASLKHNITHSFYPSKIIINPHPKINKHRLHLAELYNNHCYITENLNIYGKIIEHTPNKKLTVSWLNSESPSIQNYKYLNNNTLINYAYT